MGLGVDQKFTDLVPILFDKSLVLKDLGMNLAFWNIHERNVVKKEGQYFVNEKTPLRFIHFSSFPMDDLNQIANKQTIYTDFPNAIYKEIWIDYKKELEASVFYYLKSTPYSYNYFHDGMIINDFLRRNYVDFVKKFPRKKYENPFLTKSNYRKNLRRNYIRLSKTNESHINFKIVDRSYSKADRLFTVLFRVCLFLLGPYKYDLFIKYLNYKTISTRDKHESC